MDVGSNVHGQYYSAFIQRYLKYSLGRGSISCRRSSSRLCIRKRWKTDSKSKKQNKRITQCQGDYYSFLNSLLTALYRPHDTQSWKPSIAFYQIQCSPRILRNTHSLPLPSMSLSNHVSCAHPLCVNWALKKCSMAALMIGLGVVEVF